jgi:hypothetical protein
MSRLLEMLLALGSNIDRCNARAAALALVENFFHHPAIVISGEGCRRGDYQRTRRSFRWRIARHTPESTSKMLKNSRVKLRSRLASPFAWRTQRHYIGSLAERQTYFQDTESKEL